MTFMCRRSLLFRIPSLLGLLLWGSSALADVAGLQQEWAHIMYQLPADAREEAMAALADRAGQEVAANPEDPELLIWRGIVLSTYAGEKGGLGALGLAKEARASLEQALKLDETALQGSAYTSLGSLYYKVPGWPIGFGSDKKAREYLERALALNPEGIDPNFFMGEFLYEQGEYQDAMRHLQTALRAPDRPGRLVADQGRRQEIRELVQKLDGRLAAR